MSKYIITNCPSCRDFDIFGLPNEGCCYNFQDYCKNHNECAMKQIVELCKEENYAWLAKEILELLDIQEVE